MLNRLKANLLNLPWRDKKKNMDKGCKKAIYVKKKKELINI